MTPKESELLAEEFYLGTLLPVVVAKHPIKEDLWDAVMCGMLGANDQIDNLLNKYAYMYGMGYQTKAEVPVYAERNLASHIELAFSMGVDSRMVREYMNTARDVLVAPTRNAIERFLFSIGTIRDMLVRKRYEEKRNLEGASQEPKPFIPRSDALEIERCYDQAWEEVSERFKL